MATKLTHCHTIGASDSLTSRLLGALAFTVVWGLGQFIGPLSLPLLLWSAVNLPYAITAILAAAMAYPFCVRPESLYSPLYCRFVLSMAGWLKGGSSLWASDDVLLLKDRLNEGIMVCYHPHGLIPCGFTLNGAVRARAQDNATYLPPWMPLNATVSGVQAPVLFKIPILRHILLGFGCCVPATKAGVRKLLNSRTTFGIIPGGSEEVAIHEPGRESAYTGLDLRGLDRRMDTRRLPAEGRRFESRLSQTSTSRSARASSSTLCSTATRWSSPSRLARATFTAASPPVSAQRLNPAD